MPGGVSPPPGAPHRTGPPPGAGPPVRPAGCTGEPRCGTSSGPASALLPGPGPRHHPWPRPGAAARASCLAPAALRHPGAPLEHSWSTAGPHLDTGRTSLRRLETPKSISSEANTSLGCKLIPRLIKQQTNLLKSETRRA